MSRSGKDTRRRPARPICVLLAAGLGIAGCAAAPVGMSGFARPEATGGCSVSRVVDGDTVDLSCPGEGTLRARLIGFDTPEIFSPGCPRELAHGRRARTRMQQLVRAGSAVRTTFLGTDRYDRRLVRLHLDGRDVADTMVTEGLAVRYAGGRRINWCTRLDA